ncbi:MAG TPA: PIN domain-containing protein [Bacillota bacterium]|nr:PIN domain-containing protein [Bacillota bacterium]
MSKSFIDTNILIYAMDRADPLKQRQSRAILQGLLDEDHSGVISTQILQEFYVTASKKLKLDGILVKSILHNLENYEVVVVNPDLIEAAVDCSILNRLSFWDALVIVSAESASCDTLLSEDLNHGQIIRGVKVVNPFLNSLKPEQFHEQQATYLK